MIFDIVIHFSLTAQKQRLNSKLPNFKFHNHLSRPLSLVEILIKEKI